MISTLMQILNRTDSLIPTPQQQKELLDYGKSIAPRFAALRAIQQQEDRIVELTLTAWQQAFSDLGDPADYGWTSADADLRGAIRSITLGMVLDDLHYAEQTCLLTLRRTLEYAEIPADAIHGLFAGLHEAVRAVIPNDTAQYSGKFFQQAMKFAEPDTVAI